MVVSEHERSADLPEVVRLRLRGFEFLAAPDKREADARLAPHERAAELQVGAEWLAFDAAAVCSGVVVEKCVQPTRRTSVPIEAYQPKRVLSLGR